MIYICIDQCNWCIHCTAFIYKLYFFSMKAQGFGMNRRPAVCDSASGACHVQAYKEYLYDKGLRRAKLGVAGEYTMSPALYARLQQEIEETQIELASDILVIERAVKTEFYIKCIWEVARLAKRGIEAPESVVRPGVLEADIAGEIEHVRRRAGSQGFPHHTMVDSGRDKIGLR